MAKKPETIVIISVNGLSRKEEKRITKELTREVVKDKRFRKTLKRSETPIPKDVAKAAARAAVVATLGLREEPPAPKKKTGLEIYTELVAKFAAARKKYKQKQKKQQKAAKKQGLDPKTGLFVLKKAEKLVFGKKAKPYKAKKAKK